MIEHDYRKAIFSGFYCAGCVYLEDNQCTGTPDGACREHLQKANDALGDK